MDTMITILYKCTEYCAYNSLVINIDPFNRELLCKQHLEAYHVPTKGPYVRT